MLINTLPIVEFNEFKRAKNSFGSVIGVYIPFQQLNSNEIINSFFENNTEHFICIDFGNYENSPDIIESVRNLILLCFNINYYKIDEIPLVTVIDKNKIHGEIILKIKNEFIRQGYDDLKLIELNTQNEFVLNNEYCLALNKINDVNSNELYKLFFKDEIIDKLFFIYTPIENISIIKIQIFEIEKLFEKNEPCIYKFLKIIRQTKINSQKLERENKLLKTKIENANLYQDLLRKDTGNIINWYKNEIEKIKDWYNKQYEILPLWYKRFGHIIKKFIHTK